MKIFDIVNKINAGTKASDVAKEIGIAPNTLSRNLKKVSYQYNNTSKKYEFVGEQNEKSKIDLMEFESKNQNIISKKSDKNNQNEVKKDEIILTNEEKRFIKELYSEKTDIALVVDFSRLPARNKTKKHSIEISEQTYDEFETFSLRLKEKRYTKNDLIEMALQRFMREYRGI